MMAIPFDTLLASKKLQEKGFSAEQAEASVEMVKEVIEAIENQQVTKQDIVGLKRDIVDVRKDLSAGIETVKAEIKSSENKTVMRLGVMMVAGIGVLSVLLNVISRLH